MAEEAEVAGNTRTYKVLQWADILVPNRHDAPDPGQALVPAGDYTAGDHRGAIRQAVKLHGFAKYVAIAESGWHEDEPKPDPEPRIRWGTA